MTEQLDKPQAPAPPGRPPYGRADAGRLGPWSEGRPRHLLELACKVIGASRGGIALLSGEGELVEHMTFGLSDEAAAGLWHGSWIPELIQFVLEQPLPTRLADLAADFPRLGSPPGLEPLGPFLGIPLVCHGRWRGALYVARARHQPAFSREEEDLVLPIRTWLEQGSLFEEARLLAQVRLLNRVAHVAAGSLDLHHILSVALSELNRHLPLNVSALWLVESGRPGHAVTADPGAADADPVLVLAEAGAIPRERVAGLGLEVGARLALTESCFASCLREGRALYADWGSAGERGSRLAEDLAGRGATCCFAVPLHAGERALGVLQSICTRPGGFTGEQIQILYHVADLLGPAVSNCQLYGRLKSAYEELRVTQGRLIQAEKMRALGEMAGGMAHDFNNSLCGVLGFLELALLDPGLPPACLTYLESARTCSLDAAQTVRRVQNFARWRRHETSVQTLDLDALVQQTMELIRHKWENLGQARGAAIRVEARCEASAMVSGTVSEIREVLTNLVFNAVDAMPNGGQLTVRTWSTPLAVFLAVTDTGVGMSDSVRRRLFEPFFTTKGERGNGMGLSVTFGIVQRYGGEISVESAVGQGSTFTVRMPRATPSGGGQPVDTGSPVVAAPGKSLRVLVVDDEEAIRRYLESGLAQLGHRPRVVADAYQALAALNEEPFDAVLTDLGLPGLSGEEVAKTVARQSPKTPVILVTGWADQLKAEANPIAGVSCVLGKPVTLTTLAATLAAVCKEG